ncbi:PAS-domain containing protein [Gammaproteobacteria bacterium]|nr:PAS-domain containing protein [Gammaproteobacteria bacterium]
MSAESLTEHSSAALTELVEGGVNSIYQLLTINAEGNLVVGLLAETANVPDPALIQPIRERFTATEALVERSLRQLPASAERRKLIQAMNTLLVFGKDADNIFDLRESGQRAGVGPGSAVGAESKLVLDGAARSHESVLALLIPMIDDATFDLIINTEGLSAQSTRTINTLVEEGVDVLHALLLLRAEGNLTAGLLSEAANVVDTHLLQPIHERFTASKAHIERILAQSHEYVDSVSTASQALIDLGSLNGNFFDLRRQQLRQIADARDSLGASRGLTVQLVGEVAKVVKFSQKDSDAAVRISAETINNSKWVMLIVTGSSIAIAALMILYYVGPRVVEPLERITEAMSNLAGGNTVVDIPARDRDDELGRMARALAVFKDTAIEMQKSNLAEIREARQRLVAAIETITEGFSLYDSEDRLVICNNRYLKILYPDTSEEITPGMTFESMIRRAAEKGYVKAAENRVEEWVMERLASHRNPADEPRLQQRGDSTWVLVSERKTDDGGTVAVYSDVTELKQREGELASKSHSLEQLSNQLAKYLSPQVYESIFSGKHEVKITSRRKKLTVFFSDIVSFTETADRLESEELTQLLNHYLTEMSRIALDYGATIDKFIGDAIVIFFGDPESRGVKEDALACVEMAIAMRQRMVELEYVWRAVGIKKPLQCRMGISTDYCTVGNFGSEDRMDYTIIGGGVNLASRLESLAKPGGILIAYETYAQIKDRIHCEECGEAKVKGIAYPVATYRVVDFHDNLESGHRIIRESNSRLNLDLDLDTMSPEERKQTAIILQRALDSLTDTGNISGSTMPPEADDRKA